MNDEDVTIWSTKHRKFWQPRQAGYTDVAEDAGRYSAEEAGEICARTNRHPMYFNIIIPSALALAWADWQKGYNRA